MTIKKLRLRFDGFNNQWIEKKIGEIADEYFGGGTPATNNSKYWNGELPWIQSSDLINHKVYKVVPKKRISDDAIKNSAAKIIPANSIAIVTRVGVGKVSLIEYSYSTSQDFLSLSKLNIDKWFGVYLLYKKLQNELKQVQGTSIKGITKKELLEKTINVPTYEEQIMIGHLFKDLDELISTHQQELDIFIQSKELFFKKMFPKDGLVVPEFRFPEFTSEWNVVLLNEIAKIVSGGTPDTREPSYWDGEVDWYAPTEIGKSVYACGSVRKITQLGLEKSSAKLLPANKTILFTSRAGIGDTAILKREGATNQGFQSMVVQDNCDAYFLYSMTNRIKKYALKNASGSTFLEISGKNLGKMSISIPSIEEQIKIGEFFRQLDEVIELKKKELEALKETKRAFLQKMFV